MRASFAFENKSGGENQGVGLGGKDVDSQAQGGASPSSPIMSFDESGRTLDVNAERPRPTLHLMGQDGASDTHGREPYISKTGNNSNRFSAALIGAESGAQQAEGSGDKILASGIQRTLDPDPVKSAIAQQSGIELDQAEYSFTSASALKLSHTEAVT